MFLAASNDPAETMCQTENSARSGSGELAKRVPKAKVVRAFNTVPSEVQFGVYKGAAQGAQTSLVYCGDDEESKKVAAALIRDVGFEPVDAGPLRIACCTEPFALLMGQLAYEGSDGRESMPFRTL